VGKGLEMNAIVAGVDASEESRAALAWAVEEGRLRQAPVLAVHAWELPVVATPNGIVPPDPELLVDLTQIKEDAEELVRRVVEQVAAEATDVDVRGIAVAGKPVDALLDTAEQEQAQLVVVGSRGHGGFLGLLLGSVSDQVVRNASCPVVVHRRRGERDD
jgi:nucleotide-binding universal stress UspA family protein